ncbi:hypothetical protein B9Z19DRAFT_1065966 [Tuber borchii]|uniref:Uncharacterized protein n=1 Tax=Tuber borchii TaxID=42251 RepID=A0A2T6ZP97_TUBBO|nr:hypothetical protein B9Z19DRAFT_1065966 [Tuber borchii]
MAKLADDPYLYISLLATHSSELQPAGNGRKVWWSGSEKTRGIDKKGKNDCQMLQQLQQRNKMCGAAIFFQTADPEIMLVKITGISIDTGGIYILRILVGKLCTSKVEQLGSEECEVAELQKIESWETAEVQVAEATEAAENNGGTSRNRSKSSAIFIATISAAAQPHQPLSLLGWFHAQSEQGSASTATLPYPTRCSKPTTALTEKHVRERSNLIY